MKTIESNSNISGILFSNEMSSGWLKRGWDVEGRSPQSFKSAQVLLLERETDLHSWDYNHPDYREGQKLLKRKG